MTLSELSGCTHALRGGLAEKESHLPAFEWEAKMKVFSSRHITAGGKFLNYISTFQEPGQPCFTLTTVYF